MQEKVTTMFCLQSRMAGITLLSGTKIGYSDQTAHAIHSDQNTEQHNDCLSGKYYIFHNTAYSIYPTYTHILVDGCFQHKLIDSSTVTKS